MSALIEPEAPPLRGDDSGAIRVGTTRVLLEPAFRAFQAGATPGPIVQEYDWLDLGEVYKGLPDIRRRILACRRP